jgi:uncharacterized repeat protein (TIGR03803 family)
MLYGTTSQGGTRQSIFSQGDGTIFRFLPGGGYELVGSLGANARDGAHPLAGLIQASDGALYGTAENGGGVYSGTVFRFTLPAGASR